jgi:hypothetical protein
MSQSDSACVKVLSPFGSAIIMKVVLIFCCAAAGGVLARCNTGIMPTNDQPQHYIPAFLDDEGGLIIWFESWTAEQSVRAFLLSLGLGVTSRTREVMQGLMREFESYVGGIMKSNRIFSPQDDPVVLPVKCGGGRLEVIFLGHDDDPYSVAKEFLLSHGFTADIDRGIVQIARQLKLRKAQAESQRNSFDIHPHSQNEACAANRVEVPTFVINLWFATARRRFMTRQVDQAGLHPVYLMLGVDALRMPQFVLREVLVHCGL